jgi:hypothetical protein
MDFTGHLTDAPIPNLLVLAGLVFLGIAAVGKVSGKIEPNTSGRIMSGVLGLCVLFGGLYGHSVADNQNNAKVPLNSSAQAPAQQPPSSAPDQQKAAGTQTPPPAPQGFRVIEVFLRADPFDYTGPCPTKITFSGRISVVGGAGPVSYKFLRNDGASAPVESLYFEGPGSKDIGETWTLGGSALPTYSGWEAVQIFDPQEMKSNQAPFKIRCQ